MTSGLGPAGQMRKLEIMKGGKLPITSAERYKRMLKKKLDETLLKPSRTAQSGFMLPGTGKTAGYKQSKKADMAMKEIAKRKAVKEEKALRQMVVIKPRWYRNVGRLDDKGNVYDEVGNLVLKVNGKKGTVNTMGGWKLGKYRPKKAMHQELMIDWIQKHSPYHIRLRQLEYQKKVAEMYAMQHGLDPSTVGGMVSVHGMPSTPQEVQDQAAGRTNLGVTTWGVMSSNVHGTFGENVHGGFADNVWGRASTNVWGGIGDPGGFWSKPGRSIWGSGKPGQKNFIKIGLGMVLARLGLTRPVSNRGSGGSGNGGGSRPTARMR